MDLNVTQNEIDLFASTLWKDIRKLEVGKNSSNELTFRRYSDKIISIANELPFLEFLKEQNPSWQIPKILNRTEEYIEFEYLDGIRLFNFIIELRHLYLIENSTKALAIMERIKIILTKQLLDFQRITKSWCSKIEVNYPFHERCFVPIQIISNVLSYKFDNSEVNSDIKAITEIVSANSNSLFRDAAAKNAILHLPELYYSNFKYDDAERRIIIRSLVDKDYFTDELLNNKIYQFDFTGCAYLCPQVDDLIAINLHESMYWANSSKTFYNDNVNDSSFLAAVFVRLLRFGGRKLAYRLLHKEGHKIRFRYDYEKLYFEILVDVIERLQQKKIVKGTALIAVMKEFQKATDIIPNIDYFDPTGEKTEICYVDTPQINYNK
jgi:hypothetical protein